MPIDCFCPVAGLALNGSSMLLQFLAREVPQFCFVSTSSRLSSPKSTNYSAWSCRIIVAHGEVTEVLFELSLPVDI